MCVAAAQAEITNSKHDLSLTAGSGEICIVCHTPHNSDTTVTDAPLWNHEVTTATYTVYSSPTMDVTVGQPGGTSKLCLSCHDGTVAVDNYGGNTSGSVYIASSADITTDLSDDHPIGMDWAHQTLADGSGTCTENCHFVNGEVTIRKLPVFEGDVECATCHDVHNADDILPSLLRITMEGSQLCLTCHTDKG